jgi:hypothetical protein
VAKKKKKGRPDDEKPGKKKKARKVFDDELDDEDDGGYNDAPDTSDRPRNNVYVGLGGITLLAFLLGATFLYLDHSEMEKKPAPTASVTVNDLKLAGRGQ